MKKTKSVRKAATYPYPPEVVWKALTDPHALAEWTMMANNFRAEAGAKFEFRYNPMLGLAGINECEVLEFDPPRKMVWSWTNVMKNGTRHGPMRVSWTLTPEGQGTRLELLHEGLEMIPWLFRRMMGFGWGSMVRSWLPKVLRNVSPDGSTFVPGAIPLAKRERCVRTSAVPPGFIR